MADSEGPLSTKTIWLAAAVVLLVGAAATTWLLLAFGYQLEAIKTASTVFLGTGGAAALLLAARRQRSTEIALTQKERDLHHQEHDALERRITDLYTKAADQLGSDKAPVRLAGLYALERVAQNNPTQRQTIVNLLCAYLRMPYQPPDDEADPDHRERLQEREVRLTAQRLLADHLRSGDPEQPLPTFWACMNLDLTGATLADFSLTHCTVHTANFRAATFSGDADCRSTTFTDANFAAAKFAGRAAFGFVTFLARASFVDAFFAGYASFMAASFGGIANFSGANFHVSVDFGGDPSEGIAAATFSGPAFFHAVTFGGLVDFDMVTFRKDASFGRPLDADSGAKFKSGASFAGAEFGGRADFGSASFNGYADFREATFDDIAVFGRVSRGLESTTFDGNVNFEHVGFARGVPEEARKYWTPPLEQD